MERGRSGFIDTIRNSRIYRNLTESPAYGGKDPNIVSYEDKLILAHSVRGDTAVSLRVIDNLADIQRGTEHVVYQPDPHSDHGFHVWSPALQKFPGYKSWFIYLAASDGKDKNHRMRTLRSKTSDPLGEYEDMGPMADSKHNYFAIDPVVFMDNGEFRVAYSGRRTEDDAFPQRQNIYIAPMDNPWTISGERSEISTPTYAWEVGKLKGPKFGGEVLLYINEGPEIHKPEPIDPDAIFYAGGPSWGIYPMGKIERIGLDVLNPDSWKKHPEPIFPNGGHGCVVYDRGIMKYVYAATTPEAGWPGRNIYSIDASEIPDLGTKTFRGNRFIPVNSHGNDIAAG